MYNLKPIVTDFEVDKPRNMYAVKEIHNPTDTFLTKLEESLKVEKEGDLNELVEKQELLLDKLKELKRQLVSLQDGLPLCRKPAQPRSFPDDLVISVDPSTIPYSLLLMQRSSLGFSVTFYTHSSVAKLPEEAKKFAEEIQGLTSGSGSRVTVIWRLGLPASFQVSVGVQGSCFWGEDNFIRYLTRLGLLKKSSDSDDLLLDLTHHLLALADDKKEQTRAADRLIIALKKQKTSQSVDLATYSALRNFRNASKGGKVDAVLKELEARL
uniref:AIMP2 thioredoxin-like domain-containing protein n=1 Tax=Phlebotomus kandelakii TaxID=1109342 RepID=A0A6B2EI60_9DIPT